MKTILNKLVQSLLILILVSFITEDLFSQPYDQNPADIQEIERYYDGNGVLKYDRYSPGGSDNDALAGKNAITSLTQNTFRLIYTWVLDIPTNATVTSATLYIGGTAHSNAQLPIVNIQYQIKKFPDDKYSAQPQDQWNAITGSEVLRTEAVPLSGEFDGELSLDQSFIDYIQSSLIAGKLHISIRGTDEETFGTNRNIHYIDYKYTQHNVLSALRIVINYTTPTNVNITAMNNFEYGTIKVGVNVPPVQQNSPYSFSPLISQTVNLEAQNQSYGGYERVWNDYDPNATSVWLRNGVFFSNQIEKSFIVTQSDDNATYEAGLRKNYRIDQTHKTEFDGDLTQQSTAWIVEQNSGDITAPNPHPNYSYYNFAGWTDDLTLPNTRTITPTDNETYTALYKYPHHSNDVNAYKSNSQKKFVQTPDGVKHIVYESMDKIWYEISTDGGSTWRIMNDGKPLNTDLAKNPSIDYHGNVVAIVFQQNNGGYYDIKLSTFYAYGNDYIFGQNTLVNYDQYDTYSSDANPVIGWGYNGRALIVWAGAYNGPFGPIDALVYKYSGINYTSFSVIESGYVLNSTGKSVNPTVYYNEYAYSTKNFHIAWEEQTTSTISKIYYQRLYPDGNDKIQFADYYEASYGSGYSRNYRPAIVSQDFQNLGGRREDIRLSWIGYRDAQQQQELLKGNAVSTGETRVLHKQKLFSWSGLSVFGDKVAGMSQNHGDNIFNNYQAYALAWSEDNSGTITNKYIRSHETTTVRTLTNSVGNQIQVNNSTDFYDMYVNAFQNSTSPYSFALSGSLSGGLSKENSLAINQGREGVVVKDSAEFYFAIGDIILDGENVNFVEFDDTLAIEGREMLNDYLLSLPLSVNNNSSLTYGVQYGIVDSAFAVNALSDGSNINFRVQLIDDQTGEVIGLFDNITYSQDNVFQYNNVGYQLDMTGIGNRTVRLKLVVNTESESDYSLSKRFADEVILGKAGYKQVKYQGSLAVTDYAIEQNYPNPFNPSTTIRYQIPQDGLVTLKVYDILGKEVATLVNDVKASGRYEVNFNASSLASGVYLYRLIVNEYVNVKKMLLLK